MAGRDDQYHPEEVAPGLPGAAPSLPDQNPDHPPARSGPHTPAHAYVPAADTVGTLHTRRASRPAATGSSAGFWIVAVPLLLAIVGIGLFANRGIDRSAADPPARTPTVSIGSLVDLEWNGTPASTSTTIPSVQPGVQTQMPQLVGTQLAPATVHADEARIYGFGVRYYDSATFDGPWVQQEVSYDEVDDDATIWSYTESGARLVIDHYQLDRRYRYLPDGTIERADRNEASLAPGPDHPLARRLTQDDVVPDAARRFTSVAQWDWLDAEPDTGTPGRALVVVEFDVAGFAAAHPAVHAQWVERWTDPATRLDESVVPAPPQVVRTDDIDTDNPIDLSAEWLAAERPENSLVSFVMTAAGTVHDLSIFNPVDQFRVEYLRYHEPDPPTFVEELEDPGMWSEPLEA